MAEDIVPHEKHEQETIIDVMRKHQEEILKAGGKNYLERAARAVNIIGSWYPGHEPEDVEILMELKALKPEQIAAVMSSMQAVERIREKAMEDSQLAKEILYKCLGNKDQRILEEMLGRPIGPENASRALSCIDIYRLADTYLKETYLLCLGRAVHSVRRAWEKA